MKNAFLLTMVILLAGGLSAQFSYETTDLAPLKLTTYDPLHEDQDFAPRYLYHEAPSPDGGKYASLKAKVAERYPRKPSATLDNRSVLPEPEIIFDFKANSIAASTPPDNSFGVSADGTNISAVNSELDFRDGDGNRIFKRSLNAFSNGIASAAGKFDPRVIYDPEQDRFVMVWLAGTTPELSTILMAFSSSSDISEPWFVTSIEGSPEVGKWTDYPMISLSDKELFLTINLIEEGEGWMEGFRGTLIYQIDKIQAYAGIDPNTKMWSDIKYDSQFIRNLHPVKSADGFLEAETYFLSNRNFAVENDTIFILKINSDQSDSAVALEAEFRTTNTNYGAPPNALQSEGVLQTNDARILDAHRQGEVIEFVGNTVDPATGKAAIYHGKFNNISSDTREVTGNIITHPIWDLGYPGIAWTGIFEGDDESIIVAQYSSETDFAGITALYTADDDYSEWTVLREGKDYIDILNDDVERWGDYTGCQRKYDSPGIVWTGSSFATSFGGYETRISVLNSPLQASVKEAENKEINLAVFPNPVSERITVSLEVTDKEYLDLCLYDSQGRLVHRFFNSPPKTTGQLDFSFDIAPLESGLYRFVAMKGGNEILSKSVIKQ